MNKYLITLLFLILSLPVSLKSQELKCNIQFSTDQIQGTNKKIFETLQQALFEFANNRSWTNHVYSTEEKIECNMLFTISEYSGENFKGTLQVQSRRPIYNSSYNSVLLNYLDQNVSFTYVEMEALEFNESTYSSLTSLVAYYIYVIIGLDYDSYALRGGSDYFNKAEAIVNAAQTSSDKGWKSYEGSNNKNRYWLIQNLLDEKYADVREFIYSYHRLGLDKMADKINEGRSTALESVKLLQKVYRAKPDNYMLLLQIMNDAKNEEWVKLFSEATAIEKTTILPILKEIDPTNSSKYQAISQ
jgi:hypothetical protein